MKSENKKISAHSRAAMWLQVLILSFCFSLTLSGCGSNDSHSEDKQIKTTADQVWAFGQSHPDGFTLDIRSMTEPKEGIAVSYAATRNSHTRPQLEQVVRHALSHDGYVGS